MISVIIPSRNEKFLYRTVLDLLAKAHGQIEIIVVLDGYWPPNEEIINDARVHYIHRSRALGMRNAINTASAIAKGEYLMKCDAHCMFAEGFDNSLLAHIDDDWVVIPRRKRLDAENWKIQDVGKPDVDYEFLSFPYWHPNEVGIHGTIWTERIRERLDRVEFNIDDNPAFQGSCWFMSKKHFDNCLEGMQEDGYGSFIGEPQEIGMKTWLSGGRLVVNKSTWYAHLHKGKTYGRGYSMNKSELIKGNAYSVDYWMNDRWPKAKYTMEWFVNEKFPDMPTWPKDWRQQCIEKGLIKPKTFVDKKTDIVDKIDNIISKFNGGGRQIVVDINRNELAELFNRLGYKIGAEIGVERALYSEVLFKAIPNLKLNLIDPLQAYRGYREHVSQEKLDGFFKECLDRIGNYNYTFHRRFSMDAVGEFENNSLDFVYIDGNHDFKNTTNDIAEWSKKVRKGGIVAGHDFSRNKKKDYKCHVKDVVQAWTYANGIEPWFITNDKSPSWFYIKT